MQIDEMQSWDIVIVSHNSGDVLRREWSEVSMRVRDRVICVENGDSRESLDIAKSLFRRVVRTANSGLSAANNFGFALGDAPYVLFVNPDVRVLQSSFATFVRWLDEKGGLVAPRLIDHRGAPQESCRDWPSFGKQIANRILPAGHAINQTYLWPSTSRQFVPWILGAAVAAKRSDMAVIGGWPEEYFLYFEDTELSWRAWSNDLPVALLETERWYHAWERGSRSLITTTARHHIRSAVRFYMKHPLLAAGLSDRAVRRSRRR